MHEIVIWRDLEAEAAEQYEAELKAARVADLKRWLREKNRLRAKVEAANTEELAFIKAYRSAMNKPLTEPLGDPPSRKADVCEVAISYGYLPCRVENVAPRSECH